MSGSEPSHPVQGRFSRKKLYTSEIIYKTQTHKLKKHTIVTKGEMGGGGAQADKSGHWD